MNKRLKKKSDKIRRNAIHALLDTVLDINGLAPRTRAEVGELPTAFMRFSGHIGVISVDVYRRGWEPDNRSDFTGDAHTFQSVEIMELNNRLKGEYL